MKKVWLGIGAAVIVILLLLQTRFSIFMILEEGGYAVFDNGLKQTLMMNPDEVEGDITFPYYRFETLDCIYSRGSRYYMGAGRKREIDLGFPLYVDGGAGVLFTNSSCTLFDVDYEEADVYRGMVVNGGISYNPGGEQADAAQYLFGGLSNGLFINFDEISYEDRQETRQVDRNSIIYFAEDYFAYSEHSEQNGGEGHYQVCRNIKDSSKITVNGEEFTYRELLLRLHIISEKKPIQRVDAGFEFETPTPSPIPPVTDSEKRTAAPAVVPDTDDKRETPAPVSSGRRKPAASSSREPLATNPPRDKRPSQTSGSPATGQVSRGERPDYMRPDKVSDKNPTVQEYVKPTAAVNGVTAGVYRIVLDVAVSDPAGRLHPQRKVQFEFFEVGANGKETLVYRCFTGSSNKALTVGNGAIKPGTTYRINAYFTYYNEYDEMVVESIPLDDILTDSMITTSPFDSLGVIDMGSPAPEYYYDHHLELPNVQYAEGTDEEAVYGINRSGGIKLIVEGGLGFSTETIMDGATIRTFKNGAKAVFSSASDLESKSKYSFTIVAEDYFGNKLNLINNTGDFETCKGRPEASLELVTNKLGNIVMDVRMSDPDFSAIPAEGGTDYDLYLVYSTKPQITREECEAYLANNGPVGDDPVHFVYKFGPDEYLKDGSLAIKQEVKTATLDLNQKYYAFLMGDYDLNNRKGAVRFDVLARLNFTSASLSSLGDIYIKVDISNVTAHSAVIAYTLNAERTLDELEALLSSVRFNIVRTNGEEKITDSYIEFDTNAMTAFSGYDHGSNGAPEPFPWNELAPKDIKSIMMDASYFNGSISEEQHELRSMTDYVIVPEVWATYNGKKYEMEVSLSNSSFKTMKEPANVIVKDVLLAGETLRFKVRIDDFDGAIVGNSGHVVRMNLYQQDGTFIRAIRIPKNTDPENEEFQQIEFNNLDPKKTLRMTFIAVEYNEGYTNATFESNKIIKEVLVDEALSLTGSIKLQEIVASAEAGKLRARVKVTLNDDDKVLADSRYYVRVEKDGKDVTSLYPASYTVPADGYETVESTKKPRYVDPNLVYSVDHGEHTYKMTLYVIINGNTLILDTLTFTSEQLVVGIGSAEDFVWSIKNSVVPEEGVADTTTVSKTKFVITDDITIDSNTDYKNPADGTKTAKGRQIVSIFDGEIDFQGYTLDFTCRGDNHYLFGNLGADSNIYNMVFNVTLDNPTSRMWYDGALCCYNFGRIHDVEVNFKGGQLVQNLAFGLLCYYNTVSGVIENFVVCHDPGMDALPLMINQYGGLVCHANAGTIRNGYAYGEPIYTDISPTTNSRALQVGGIAGYQGNTGRMSNVYSLVNVTVPAEENVNNKTLNTAYGSVIGSAAGRISNVYGIGQSLINRDKDDTRAKYRNDVGPVLGTNTGRRSNVFFWNEGNNKYNDTIMSTQQMIGLDTLHDYGWQAKILGDQFDTSPVEVGYYPHVALSDELPTQPYIPLPDKKNRAVIEFMSASVLEYVENGEAAIVEFRFNNPQNANIMAIHVENLDVEIDQESAFSLDGYTTLQARVYNPKKFRSAYAVTAADYSLRGNRGSVPFDPAPLLMVDFYRRISTPDEWYNHVVKEPTENARLANDIDFAGVKFDRIRVTTAYSGKLDGGGSSDGSFPGYTLKNITIAQTSGYNTVFYDVTGEITNLCVEHLRLGSGAAVRNRTGFMYRLNGGRVDNVHIKDAELAGYEYIGGLAAECLEQSDISNCSISGLKITYKEPANTNTTGRIGGLAATTTYTNISNCYVRDLDMKVEDIRNCQGAGGLVGYCNYSPVENAYVTGNMEVRGSRVGGIAGYYYSSRELNSMKNVLARVNITCYQDKLGGIIGGMEIYDSNSTPPLTPRTNFSGVALGNVLANNPDSECVSCTVGDVVTFDLYLYGCEAQLFNGMVGTKAKEKDTNTAKRFLTLDQMHDPASYTGVVRMGRVYDYSPVTRGCMPVLYYEGTNIPLPFQTDTYLCTSDMAPTELSVSDVMLDQNERKIVLDFTFPEGAAECNVTAVNIVNLLQNEVQGSTCQTLVDAAGKPYAVRYTIWYRPVENQEHWQDSYLLDKVSYTKTVNGVKTAAVADFSGNPVRIPLTLYADIYDVNSYTKYVNDLNNYGNYENYRVTADIDFGKAVYTKNAKLGRLLGGTGTSSGYAKLSNIDLNGDNVNFIFRLNSELGKITFENCNVKSAKRNGVGLVGASAAKVHDVEFKNVTVTGADTSSSQAGMIGYQVGGSLEKIGMEDVKVICNTGNTDYIGALTGYSTDLTTYSDITAKNIEVTGRSYVGGLVGETGRGRFADITIEDLHVGARGSYVGGLVGRNASPRATTGKRIPYMWNVTVKGTPTYDDEGWVNGSSTVVEMTAASTTNYIGGIAGYSNGYNIGFGRTGGYPQALRVEGAVIKIGGGYAGGAFGEAYDAQYVTVKDVLITNNNETKTGAPIYVGGVSGWTYGSIYYNNAEHVKMDLVNCNYVGLMYGRSYSAIAYCYVTDSSLRMRRTDKSETADQNKKNEQNSFHYLGGLLGSYYNSTVRACGVYNSSVVAVNEAGVDGDGNLKKNGHGQVGGLIGYLESGTLRQSFCVAEPKSDTCPAAKEQYKIEGEFYVGGLVGYQEKNAQVQDCYSNMNVSAVGKGNRTGTGVTIHKGEGAGGLVGGYNNSYSVSVVSGRNVLAYANAYLCRNYFAGTVSARKYAGGAIGVNRMALQDVADVAQEHKASGGRSTTKITTSKYGEVASAAANERDRTYGNLILAEKVSAEEGSAYAFSGYQDGFEGNANGVGSTAGDASAVDRASHTFFFAGMKVGQTGAERELFGMKNTEFDAALRTTGTYRYKMWNEGEYDALSVKSPALKGDTTDKYPGLSAGTEIGEWYTYSNNQGVVGFYQTNPVNVRLVSPDDLKGRNQAMLFRCLGWVSYNDNTFKSVTVSKVKYTVENTDKTKSMKAYYFRLLNSYNDKNTTTLKTEWDQTGDENSYFGKDYLPHVRYNETTATLNDIAVKKQSALGIALPIPSWTGTRDSHTYFSLMKQGDTYAIIYPVDADRVNVEFSEDLVKQGWFTLKYGSERIVSDKITKRVYTFSYDYLKSLELTYGYGSGDAGQSMAPLETIHAKAAALARHVMVWGNEYYYINDGGIVHGTGSGASKKGSDIADPSAKTLAGSFITVYAGHALTKDGGVINVADGSNIRSASGCALLDDIVPVQHFVDYESGFIVDAFGRFSLMRESEAEPASEAPEQILKGYSGVIGAIDGSLENIKDSILLYEKDGCIYQTILGVDGFMVDMYMGDVGAPDDFKTSGIVYMTNNLSCSEPFVLVEYQNGGTAGYNYMTGQYLFKNSVSGNTSLEDYVKSYFSEDKSMYADAYSSYAANKKVADLAGTSDRLQEMVQGNSENVDLEGNSTEEEKGKAEENAQQKPDEEKGGVRGDGVPGEVLPDVDSSSEIGENTENGEPGELAPIGNQNILNKPLNQVAAEGEGEGNGELVIAGNGLGNGINLKGGEPGGELSDEVREDGEALNGEPAGKGGAGEGGMSEPGEGIGTDMGIDGVAFTDEEPDAADGSGKGGASGDGSGSGKGGASGDGSGSGKESASGDGSGSGEGGASGDGRGSGEGGASGDGRGSGEGGASGDGSGSGEGGAFGDGSGSGKGGASGDRADDTDETDDMADGSAAMVVVVTGPGKAAVDDGSSDTEELTGEEGREIYVQHSEETTPGIDTGKSGTPDGEETSPGADEAQLPEEPVSSSGKSRLITVYNQATGTYEIVDIVKYFNQPVYHSENEELQIPDFGVYVDSALATEQAKKESADGMLLYLLVAAAVMGGVGFTFYYHRKQKIK